MLIRVLLAALVAAFLATVGVSNVTFAQTKTEETKAKTTKKKEEKADTKADAKAEKKAEKKAKKAPSAKQLAARKKFSDCAKSWGDHKKSTGEKGRKAYNAYMGKCLKKDG